MIRRTLFVTCLALGAACGISQDEHDRLVQEARDRDKARFDEEMRKMQANYDEEKKKNEEVVTSKDQMIGSLEREVKKMGGDLASVRTELGARVTQLASAKTELAATSAELEQLRKLREEAEKEAAQFRALKERLKSMIDAGTLEVVMRDGRINLKLPDTLLFPSGSQRLKRGGREALESVAEALKEVGEREFLIAGHTDNVPVRRGGRFKNNWQLSTARAVEIVALLTKAGVPPERLAAAGYGEFDPIESNDTPDGRAKNRRLEIILMPQLEKIDL